MYFLYFCFDEGLSKVLIYVGKVCILHAENQLRLFTGRRGLPPDAEGIKRKLPAINEAFG